MNMNQACVIVQKVADDRGMPILEALMQYVEAGRREAPNYWPDEIEACEIFMNAGARMFAPA